MHETAFDGIMNILKRRYKESFSDAMRQDLEEFMTSNPCPDCNGHRLKPEALAILIGGKNICQLTNMTVRDCMEFFKKLELAPKQAIIARQVLKEIMARLQFLNDVGLEYLTLDRSAGTLSGGEAQRIRLATQIGSGLTGVLYILDEPSIGLHQKDNEMLLKTLRDLTDIGNTLIVVEHDEEIIRSADYLIDVGPRAGRFGGEIVYQGPVKVDSKERDASFTTKFLTGEEKIPVPKYTPKTLKEFADVMRRTPKSVLSMEDRKKISSVMCFSERKIEDIMIKKDEMVFVYEKDFLKNEKTHKNISKL